MDFQMLKSLSINELKDLYQKYSIECSYWKDGIDDDYLNYNILLTKIAEEIRERRVETIDDILN